MVHALEIIHRLLSPRGFLIDIHPLAKPPHIEAVLDNRRKLIGHLQETDDFIEYTQAEAAIQQAVISGLFTIDKQKRFEFTTYAETYPEFVAFIHDEWKDAILDEQISRRWKKIFLKWSNEFEGSKPEVQMQEHIQISRLYRV